jgi:hypothetical protein
MQMPFNNIQTINDRLQNFENIISETQVGFMKGRYIGVPN